MTRVTRVLALVAAFVAAAFPVRAQEQTGTIRGTVITAGGAPAAGAQVVLTDVSREGVWTTHSDEHGAFSFRLLEPGHYSLVVDHAGAGRAAIDDTLLGVGQELTARLTLSVGDGANPRPGTASLSLSQSARDVHIAREDIDRSFRSRDFTSLVLWAPGAFPESRAFLAIDGAPLPEQRFLIDGIETTNVFSGGPGQVLPPELAEDIQVKSSGYAAESGGSTGAVVNVVTRSGGARHSGEVGAFFSGSALNAAPRPTLQLVPTDITRAEYVSYPADGTSTWTPSYLAGGPIRRGRAWYFSSYMPTFTETSREVTFAATRAAGTFTQSSRRHSSSHNATAQVANRWRMKAAVTTSSRFIDGRLPAIDGSSNPLADFDLGQRQPELSYAVAGSYLLGNWSLSARGGLYTKNAEDEGVFQGARYVFSGSNAGLAGIPDNLQRVNGYSNVLTNFEITRDRQTRRSVQVDASAQVRWRGLHSVKAGVLVDRIGIDSLRGETGNSVTLRWNQALAGARGVYGYYEVNSNHSLPDRGSLERADAASNNMAVFLQDSWSIGSRLTLDVGVRAENERIPSFSPDPAIPATAIHFSLREKIAPRVGLAWDPTGNANAKVYASWGRFFDITKLSLPVSSFGASQLTRYYYTLDTADRPNLDVNGCPPACPGTLLRGPVSFLRPTNDPAANAIDPDLRPMSQQEIVAGVDVAVGSRAVAGLRVMHRRLDRALEDVGLPNPLGEVLTIGNPGFGRLSTFTPLGSTTPVPMPKAVRNYTAVEATFVKRLASRWSFTGIYKWSRLYGNYAGLADTDRGFVTPNRTQLFNNPVMLFDERGDESLGPLATDRTHVVKTIVAFEAPFGTQLSLWTGVASGNPLLRYVFAVPPISYPVHYRGRDRDGRLPVMPNAEVYLVHEFKLPGRTRIRLDLSVFNVLNLKTVLDRGRGVNLVGSAIVLEQSRFLGGYDAEQLMTEQRVLRDPRFMMDSAFASPRSAQLGVHVRF